MLTVVFFGGVVYGAYSWYKKSTKSVQAADSKDKPQKEVSSSEMEQLAAAIYNKEWEWLNFVEVMERSLKNEEQLVWFLTQINGIVYRKHGIKSAGFFVSEKNIQSALGNLTVTQLCVHENMKFFVVGTAQGSVLYFKNEFYENTQTGETLCKYTTIDEYLSPIAGISYTAQSQLFAIGYADGRIRIFDARNGEVLREVRPYMLGSSGLIALYATATIPVFVTLNNNYEQQLWNIQKEDGMKCLSTYSLKHLIESKNKHYLNGAIFEGSLQGDIPSELVYYFAMYDALAYEIELYSYSNASYECVLKISYEGTISCSAFSIEQLLFAFYQRGGENEGLHIWNIEHGLEVAYFTPASKNHQHPQHIYINKDKIFCLYEGGVMEMWHCDVNRRKIAQDFLNKVTLKLPQSLKVEFLRQFGLYLADQTTENYNLLVQIGSAGMEKKDIEAQLIMLQFLPPTFVEKMNSVKNTSAKK